MTQVIDLKQETLPAWHPVADAEINGHAIEIGQLAGKDHRALVIDWHTEQAWIGDWEELAAVALEAFQDQEESHADQ